MQRYWVRIALGALAVFTVGTAAIAMYHKGVEKVDLLANSADPITIPLPLLPFQVDGDRLGKIEEVQIRRETPKRISGVGLVVKLVGVPASDDLLPACLLTVTDQAEQQGPQFHCATPADSAADSLTAFGDVRFEPGSVIRSLYLPARVLDDWRDGRSELIQLEGHHRTKIGRAVITIDGDSGDTVFELHADPSGARLRLRGDSGEVNLQATPAGANLMLRSDSGGRK